MVPPPAKIKSGILQRLPGRFLSSHPALLEWLGHLSRDMSLAWQNWERGITGGTLAVTGVGIGGWAGVGVGGLLVEGAKYNIVYTWPHQGRFLEIFKEALRKEMETKFSKYASTFIFGAVPFVGTSGATPLTPGPVVASNTPIPIIGAKGFATSPANIASGTRARLPSPFQKHIDVLDEFLTAIEGTVIAEFNGWESKTNFIGDTFVGVGAPPVGLASGVSIGTGLFI